MEVVAVAAAFFFGDLRSTQQLALIHGTVYLFVLTRIDNFRPMPINKIFQAQNIHTKLPITTVSTKIRRKKNFIRYSKVIISQINSVKKANKESIRNTVEYEHGEFDLDERYWESHKK